MFFEEQASVFTLPHIRSVLSGYDPQLVIPKANTRQAAVAIIMRDSADGEEMLFIKRADKEGDPWSGHMAFPGGHKEPEDNSLQSAARRETLEEIGLDLSQAHYYGALDHQHAQPRGRTLDMLIAPHVFHIEGDPKFAPNYEVAEVVWTKLAPMVLNLIHDTETKPMQGTPTVFNGYRLEQGHFVWGLTYRILQTFFTTIDPDWQGPQER
ncbi:MAG: CoA pyrophosphatase [Gammaproteobacteria bacterium]|nr:CoA pyrophosphatase [Gammaproteobacteria bacterium]